MLPLRVERSLAREPINPLSWRRRSRTRASRRSCGPSGPSFFSVTGPHDAAAHSTLTTPHDGAASSPAHLNHLVEVQRVLRAHGPTREQRSSYARSKRWTAARDPSAKRATNRSLATARCGAELRSSSRLGMPSRSRTRCSSPACRSRAKRRDRSSHIAPPTSARGRHHQPPKAERGEHGILVTPLWVLGGRHARGAWSNG